MVVKCPNCYSTRVSKCEDPNIKWQCDKCKHKFNQGALDVGAELEKAEQLRMEKEEKERRERREREAKGIYLDKSLDLLRGCSAEVLEILYDKFSVSPYIQNKAEKLNYIAMNYSTKVIERAIKRAEKQIKRSWNKTKKESKTKDKIERERLEREKRRVKNEDGATLVFTIVGGGGFIVTLIFSLLIGDAVNHNYEGILFFGFIISLIVLFIIFVILYRENNRMIDEIYDN